MPKSPKKTPKKRPQEVAETVQETVPEDLKTEEEVDEEDEGDQKLSLLDDPVLKEFQAMYPEDFKVITQLFTDPSAIKIVVEAYLGYDDLDEFQDMLHTNSATILSMVERGVFPLKVFQKVHRPLPTASGHVDSSPSAKDVAVTFDNLTKLSEKEIRKGFETPNGGSLLTQKWGAKHRQCFEDLYARAMSGTGISAAESFILNIDGVAYRNGNVPVHGDHYSSLVVDAGNSGQYFGSLKPDTKTSSTKVIGNSTSFTAQIPSHYLAYPYYRDPQNPMSEDEYMALNFFTLLFARRLCCGESILSKDYMTLAAKLDLANECVVYLTRMICKLIHKLRPQASYAHVLSTQTLSDGNLMETANLSTYQTPAMAAARSKFKYLGLGIQAYGIMTSTFSSENGTEQLSSLCDLLGIMYRGEGASKFVLSVQAMTQSAKTQAPPLPRPLVPKSQQDTHPAATDLVGLQVAVLRFVQAKSDHPDKFTPTEMVAIETLNTNWLAGKYPSWGALLTWAKDVERGGNLKPHLKPWFRGSGFLTLDENDYSGLSSGFLVRDQDDGKAITSVEYTAALDHLASKLIQEDFARHFEFVNCKGFRYRLKYEKGGGLMSRLRTLLDTDNPKNLKTREALNLITRAVSSTWGGPGNPNPRCNHELRKATVIDFRRHGHCKPDPSSKSDPSSQQYKQPKQPKLGAAEEPNRSSMQPAKAKSKTGKTGKAKVAFEAVDQSGDTKSKQDSQFDMSSFMSAFEKGLAPVMSRLNALEEHAQESSKSSLGSALSAKSPSSSASVLELLAEIKDSQAKQAASQAELHNHVTTQQNYLRYRFEDFPGN